MRTDYIGYRLHYLRKSNIRKDVIEKLQISALIVFFCNRKFKQSWNIKKVVWYSPIMPINKKWSSFCHFYVWPITMFEYIKVFYKIISPLLYWYIIDNPKCKYLRQTNNLMTGMCVCVCVCVCIVKYHNQGNQHSHHFTP